MSKIDLNNNNIPDNKALKYKDFEKVMDKYRFIKKPFYKSPYFIGGGFIGVALVVFLILNSTIKEPIKTLNNDSYYAEYKSPINEGINYEFIEVDIKDKQVSIKTISGSRITIPSGVLVDSLGNLIKGKVILKYREFLDQKDIFMSGIPMNYDSSNTHFNFESGGMFELLAYHNDFPVFIKENNSIQVDLASEEIGNNFNIYYYSPSKKNWVYKEKDISGFNDKEIKDVNKLFSTHIDTIKSLVIEKAELANTIEEIDSKKPIKPEILDKDKFNFTINVDYKDFPELKAFKEVKFQISEKEKNFKPDYANQVWDDVEIENGEERNEYMTCFLNQKQKICFITNPVVDEKDIKIANKIYDEIYKEYKEVKDSLKERKRIIRKAIAKQSEELAEKRRIELIRRNAQMAFEIENKVTRTFQIAQFGIWNSDCPKKLPSEAIVKAKFVNENGEELSFSRVYLVLKDRNEVITISSDDLVKGLRFNPKEECMIWAVTNNNNSVGFVQSNQFKEINNAKLFTFKMDLIESSEFVKYSTQEIFNL